MNIYKVSVLKGYNSQVAELNVLAKDAAEAVETDWYGPRITSGSGLMAQAGTTATQLGALNTNATNGYGLGTPL